jgi:hypothetical protein
MANYGQTRCTKATTPAHEQIGTEKNPAPLIFDWGPFFFFSGPPRLPVASTDTQTVEGVASSLKQKSGLTGL